MRPELNIEVIIDELLLQGFAPADGPRIGRAVQRELTRLFTEQGVPPKLTKGGEIARLDGGSLDVSPQDGADRIGRQVARGLYGGFQP